MLMKRIYKQTDPPVLDHVAIFHTGTTPEQNFSAGLIDSGVLEGWISLGQGKLTLHVRPEALVYTLKKIPGRYCCHCQEKLPDDATGELARSHVQHAHQGATSPDPQSPAGYRMLNHYECVLDSTQHNKWKASQDSFSPGTLRHTRKLLKERGQPNG